MSYAMKVHDFLMNMEHGVPVEIRPMVKPENYNRFMDTVKMHMDSCNRLEDFWEFSNDYKFIKRKKG